MIEGFDAFAEAFEEVFLIGAGFAEFFENFTEGFLLVAVALELGLDGFEGFAVKAAAFGNGFQKFGQGGEVADQFVLPTALVDHALADFVHEIGQGMEAVLKLGDGGGVFAPWAQGEGVGFDGDGGGIGVMFAVAVGFGRAF